MELEKLPLRDLLALVRGYKLVISSDRNDEIAFEYTLSGASFAFVKKAGSPRIKIRIDEKEIPAPKFYHLLLNALDKKLFNENVTVIGL